MSAQAIKERPTPQASLIDAKRGSRSYQDAVDRWASVGPYYAMFPVGFAFDVVRDHSTKDARVLDPFAGRGSSVYAAAAQHREAFGIEINPVGWLYSSVKLAPAAKAGVLARLYDIVAEASRVEESCVSGLPEFFGRCYANQVLRFLVVAAATLAWRTSRTDATLMAFILVYLHGKRSATLSNQMRDGKAMAPDYAVRWWAARNMLPPEIDVLTFLTKRIEWRYARGIPAYTSGDVVLGDCTTVLDDVNREVERGMRQPFDLLFTSPPYCAVTNYHYDQWLRLWMLGGSDRPASQSGQWTRKFDCAADYTALLYLVFEQCAAVMRRGARAYVRTDAREFTRVTTIDALRYAFPRRRIREIARPVERHTQTALFGDRSTKPGEVDLIIG